MPLRPGAERIAAVHGASQGSGYLLTPRLVLTAAHLLAEDGGRPTAVVHGGRGQVACEPVARRGDQALLRATEDLVRADFGPLRIGVLGGLEPLAGCHATGFPAVEREGRRLESGQFVGTLTPGTRLIAGQYVLAGTGRPPAGTGALWAGMSGAAVFFRGLLLGVVGTELDPARWGHSRLALTAVDPELLAHAPELAVIPVRVSEQDATDAEFEDRYARTVRADHGQLRIFGLDVSRAADRPRDLDTAYLSLQATAADPRGEVRPERRRVEQALHGRRRVLLRGRAGSGKSTLIQWLAVHAPAGDLGPELAELNHAVPFVLRLRSMYRLKNLSPRPGEFLHVDGSQLVDSQPAGWAERVLRDGRALLLVDGLDEIPESDRAEAEEWLAGLLRHYPEVFCLVTVRPSAVPADWLAHLDFEELALCPMDTADRRTLIERWHRAVAAALPEDERLVAERIELAELEDALLRTLDAGPELDALTDSPLLCAMICTLHREWDGTLPRRTMDLYEAALNMLLVRRDQQRRISRVEGVDLAKEEQLAVLQQIAAWLAVNRQVEGGREDAARKIQRLLPTLSEPSRPASAEQVLSHLLNRSGLFATPTADTFAFVHRTFQDYLAAREFAEDRSFGLLLDNAGDEQWSDVIRMTVGHCPPKDRATLLRQLLAKAEHTESRALHVRTRVLAGSCLPYATRLDAEVRQQVLRQLGLLLKTEASLLGDGDLLQLASIGPELAEHLPDELPMVERAPRLRLLTLARTVGGPVAMAWLGRVAPSLAADEAMMLGLLWEGFDTAGFARTVLAAADLREIGLSVHTAEQAELLGEVGPVGTVRWFGPGRELRPGVFARVDTGSLSVKLDETVRDLGCLDGAGTGGALWLYGCEAVRDFSALAGLEVRSLGWFPEPSADHRALWTALAAQPELTELAVEDRTLTASADLAPLSGVTDLTLRVFEPGFDLGLVVRLFPGLRRLELTAERGEAGLVELAPLAALPGLRVGLEEQHRHRFTGLHLVELLP